MTLEDMKDRKRELGYTNEDIARLSGLPLGTVIKVFGGATRSPRRATIEALERILKPRTSGDIATDPKAYRDTPMMLQDARPAYGQRDPSPVLPGLLSEPAAAYGAAEKHEKKQGEYTLEDYLALPDERRVELIDGVFYDMSSPTTYHQLIAAKLHAMILSWIEQNKGSCMPFMSPVDVQLDCDNKTIVQPDVLVLCDKSKITRPRIVGAPDFVAEVLSKSTRKKDLFIKLSKYKNAGVREFWIIDPDKKTVMVWDFEHDDQVALYGFRDRIPVSIYDKNLVIDFSVIDNLLLEWGGVE